MKYDFPKVSDTIQKHLKPQNISGQDILNYWSVQREISQEVSLIKTLLGRPGHE